MYVRIQRGSTELVDPEDVTSFSVVCPADMDASELAAQARQSGVGEVLPDGNHLMVSVAAIRRLVDGRVGADWPDKLSGMIAYAERKGWTDVDSTAVRAHVERR
ncbi:hypothetical protein [Pseudonocardia sp. 73-21]|uniref:hypothetical protein n=1 Tax=Pseudonocardia sp. 73-21 TaxID=1895809 RepID=UPI00095FE696|nr:hypothetical protein [Pseudonocardia sp. 73-21]OJY53564.1 MAG: hypothetical protein BGP03_34120 [Pseudonocardia sp. 73-21]